VRRASWSVYILLLIALVGAALSGGTAYGRGRPPKDVAPDKLIVRLRANVDPQRFAARNRLRSGPHEIEQLPGQPIYLFRIADGTPPRQKATSVSSRPEVVYAEPNFIGQIPEARRRSSWVVGGDAAGYIAQWAPERMRLPAAHAISRGAGITVAVLDTGVDLEHPALAGRLLPGYDFVGKDSDPREEPADGPDSAFGHGTHVAGLVALAAPDAMILPLRTLGTDGSGDLWAQVQALQFAVANGANVVNLSFSFDERSQLFADSLADVTCTASGYAGCRTRGQVGAVIVAAAGNEGARLREWPAAYETPGLIAVGASTRSDRLADFSNFGSWVAIASPGEGILSTVPGGGYATWSGTSMATPLLSGVVALLRAADGALLPTDVVRQVVGTASAIDDKVNRRVDAASALGLP
jgi:thermitase